MVEKIKELCKQSGISLYRLEKELGFGNGTIGKWDKGVPNYARLKAVANYFDVPVSILTGEEQKEGPAPVSESRPLYPPEYDLLSPEDKELVDNMIRSLAKKKSTD